MNKILFNTLIATTVLFEAIAPAVFQPGQVIYATEAQPQISAPTGVKTEVTTDEKYTNQSGEVVSQPNQSDEVVSQPNQSGEAVSQPIQGVNLKENLSSSVVENNNLMTTGGIFAVENYKDTYAIKDTDGNVIDWTPAIQKAYDEAKVKNGIVQLPSGDVPYTAPLIIDKKVMIIGYGGGADKTTAGTALRKINDAVGIILKVDHSVLRDFLLTTDLTTDTSTGIEVGGTANNETANGTEITGVTVTKQGGDGIWLRNGNHCKLDVISNMNKGHGLRLESTTTGYDNVNANYITLNNAMGNLGSGLRVYKSYENFINATSQGNNGYGFDLNAPNNTIFGYTEGNVKGSANFGEASFSSFVIAKFVEGPPTYANHYSYVIEKLLTGTRIKNFSVNYMTSTTTAVFTPIWGTIPAGGYVDKTIPNVYGVKPTDAVYASPSGPLSPGLSYYAYVSAKDTVTIRMTNPTASDITPPNLQWRVEAIVR